MPEIENRKDSPIVTVIGIITLIAALFAVVLLLVPQSIWNLMSSMVDFKPAMGLFGSEFVGFDNYHQAIAMPIFAAGFRSTLSHAFISAALLFLSSIATGYLLLAVGKIRWLRHGLCTLLLIPLVIPGELIANAALSTRLVPLEANAGTGLLLAAICTIRYIGLPALLVSAAISHGKRSWSVPLLAGGATSLGLFALLGMFDFDFLWHLPPTLDQAQGLNTIAFGISFANVQYDIGAAINTILIMITAFLLLLAAWPITMLLKRLFPWGVEPSEAPIRQRLVALVIPGAAVSFVAIALAILSAFADARELAQYTGLPIYVLLAVFTAGCNTVLCYCLARPAICSGKAGRPVMLCVLVILTFITAGNTPVPCGEFFLFHYLGLADTWFAIALSGIASVWGVWPLIFAAKSLGIRSNTDWFRRMWKPSLALFALQAAMLMNNSMPSLIYLNRKTLLHPLVLAFQQTQSGGFMNPALLALLTLAVPVALLLTVRTAFNEKDSLGLFLPGR